VLPFPAALRCTTADGRLFAAGVDDELVRCYESWALPSERGCAWASPGRPVEPIIPARLSAAGQALTPHDGDRP
jgi:hypothetical protein